jgi:hypothetical protein
MSGSWFTPIPSTVPSFTVNSTGTSAAVALESSLRFWPLANANRVIRISSISGDDFYVTLGSSLAVAVIGTSILIPGGLITDLAVESNQDYIATISTTGVAFNVTLGRRV